jgi:hypothetical protein
MTKTFLIRNQVQYTSTMNAYDLYHDASNWRGRWLSPLPLGGGGCCFSSMARLRNQRILAALRAGGWTPSPGPVGLPSPAERGRGKQAVARFHRRAREGDDDGLSKIMDGSWRLVRFAGLRTDNDEPGPERLKFLTNQENIYRHCRAKTGVAPAKTVSCRNRRARRRQGGFPPKSGTPVTETALPPRKENIFRRKRFRGYCTQSGTGLARAIYREQS